MRYRGSRQRVRSVIDIPLYNGFAPQCMLGTPRSAEVPFTVGF